MSGKCRGTRDGGRGLEAAPEPWCPEGVALFWPRRRAADEACTPISTPHSLSVSLDKVLRSLLTCVSYGPECWRCLPRAHRTKEAVHAKYPLSQGCWLLLRHRASTLQAEMESELSPVHTPGAKADTEPAGSLQTRSTPTVTGDRKVLRAG